MTLGAWLHDLSPFFWQFTDTFGIRWYGVSYALGFAAGWLLLRWLAKRSATVIPVERVGDVILYCVIGVVAGGRLGYALFYKPSLFWTFSDSIPWWNLLAVHQGGMSSHGGMAGVVLAAWFIARGLRRPDGSPAVPHPMLHVLDMLALITPAGLLFGRLANFVNGELLGKVVAKPGEPAPWWAVKFPQEYLEGMQPPLTPAQQTQLDALVATATRPGEGWDDGMRRLIGRLQSGVPGVREQLAPFVSARHPSQLYQAVAEGLIVGLCVWWIARHPRQPGFIGAWFFVIYGILRVVTEFWRLPDSHLAQQRIMGLSRGQWLSMLMIAIGLTGWAIVRRRQERVGGWGLSAEQPGAST